MSSVTFATLHTRIKTQVETVSGFKISLRPLRPDFDPATLGDKRFAIELDTSNSGHYRDKTVGSARIDHGVSIRFLRRLPPKGQHTRYTDALDNEVAIIRALMAQTGTWQEDLRVLYTSSGREILPGGEWLLSTLSFSISHDLALA
jgi:hypothetical protein